MSEYEAPKEYVDELKALAKIQEELMNDQNIEFELKPIPPIRQNIGELVLCAEGKRLYDEYCEIYEDESKTDHEVLDAWNAYYEHRLECDDCKYV